jgi:gamma-glutamylputrescine oxidase
VNFALSFTRTADALAMIACISPVSLWVRCGLTGSHLFGQILADAINGNTKRVWRLRKFLGFLPGGRALRGALLYDRIMVVR